ncbi:MAG: YigZ family protein [Clostridia bacterium]|nr:YigZ family protein [Clostridia bacterium]
MIEKYLSVAGECITQKIIEKSRFITASRHIENEEAARAFITDISKKYSDATHNCYAYIADIQGNFLRFSDDGEPSGTAGMPMLEVLKNKNLVQTAVVVTRYFGGVKLGAGGLVRAYSGCVAENLDAAQKVQYENCAELEISCGYSFADTAVRIFNESFAVLLNTDYADEVIYKVVVKKAEAENFAAAVTNKLNGNVKIKILREYFFSFKL